MFIQYLVVIVWLCGFFLSKWMLTAEHKAEGNAMTYGQQVVMVLLSCLSFATVLYILVTCWVRSLGDYWSKPIEKSKKPE